MTHVKYIAKGFLTDASKLLDEFFERNSFEFSVFAEVWKKHHFSFIYACRESVTELNQFTQEIFKRTTLFLLSSSFKKQVGASFLLYALYRSQIIEPLVPIRVELPVFRTLKSIREKAIEEKLTSLHFVLDCLIDEAAILVAFQTLKGPTVRYAAERFERQPIGGLRVPYESALEDFKKSELLEDLLVSFSSYGEDRKSDQWQAASVKVKEFMNSGQEHLRWRDVSCAEAAVTAEASSETAVAEDSSESVVVAPVSSESHSSIGSRRFELKALQFGRNVKDSENTTQMEYPTVPRDVEKARVGKYRCPKRSKREEDDKKRKVSGDESDDSLAELFKSKLPKPSVRPRHEKPHRVRRYYKEKPSKGCRQFVESVVYLVDSENELIF